MLGNWNHGCSFGLAIDESGNEVFYRADSW